MARVERLLYVIAVVCLGWFAADRTITAVYQAAQEREFQAQRLEQFSGDGAAPSALADVESPTVGEVVQARTDAAAVRPQKAAASQTPEPSRGLVGRISIPRLGVSAIIREGVDRRTLSRAVGHVPGTAHPGGDGNSALSAHRDTFFRPLERIRPGDRIKVSTLDRDITYVVSETRIVPPTDVSVLAPTDTRTLTLITCYPFTYVGPAPDRFIVRATAVEAPSGE